MGRLSLDALTPAQRAALAAIQTDPRARSVVAAASTTAAKASSSPSSAPRAWVEPDGTIRASLPLLRLQCTLNARRHPLETARLRRRERTAVLDLLRTLPAASRGRAPWEVEVCRVGPRRLDDDNATASAKGVRDAVAQWLEVDDGSAEVRWTVVQQRGPYAVTIRVRRIS